MKQSHINTCTSALKEFEEHGFEHHQSTGFEDIEESADYIRNQAAHHGIEVIDDTQMKLAAFS